MTGARLKSEKKIPASRIRRREKLLVYKKSRILKERDEDETKIIHNVKNTLPNKV